MVLGKVKTRNWLLLFVTLGILILMITVLRPVPMVSEAEAKVLNGKVINVWEGGVKDIVFALEGTDKVFYINRGLELGLSIEKLRYQLIGELVEIKYPDYWTPLDYQQKSIHLSKLSIGDEVIFNEFD